MKFSTTTIGREWRIVFGREETHDGRPIHPDVQHAAYQAIAEQAAKAFGGYTLYDHTGGWMNDGQHVAETGHTLSIVYDPDARYSPRHAVYMMAEFIVGALDQAAVVVIHPDGRSVLLSAERTPQPA